MITSLNNGRIRHAIQLKEKSRTRNEEGLFVAEGFKMFEEAPLSKIRKYTAGRMSGREWRSLIERLLLINYQEFTKSS